MVLQRLKFGAMATLGTGVVESMDLSLVAELGDRAGRQLVARLTTYVLAQDLGQREQHATEQIDWHMPATWWDHFKATTATRWRLGRWWNHRRPPRMTTVTRDVTTSVTWQESAGFPHSSIVTNERLGNYVVYATPVNQAAMGNPSTPTYRT